MTGGAELDRKLEHKHELEDRKKYKEMKEQVYEDELDDLDLPHDIYIKLHK